MRILGSDMRILGIDPGSTATGFGIVERADGGLRHVAHGTIRPPRGVSMAGRLQALYTGISEVVQLHEPTTAVVERVFMGEHARSALVLGQARGAVLVALGGAALEVVELSPREVKQAVTGWGAADKQQVQRMVASLLQLESPPGQDAADALALAMCRGQIGRLAELGVAGRSRRRTRRLRLPAEPLP